MRVIPHYLMLVFSLHMSSCAIAVPGKQKVKIDSRPSGAQVSINGIHRGSTPITVNLNRKESHHLSLSKAKHKTYEQVLISKSNSAGEIDKWVGTALFLPLGLVAGQNAGGHSLDRKAILIHLESE